MRFSTPELSALAGALGLGLYIAGRFWDDIPGTGSTDDQTANLLQMLAGALDGRTSDNSDDMNTRNRKAFLDTIAFAEGTSSMGAYNALFGYPAAGRRFSSFADHPRVFFPYTDKAGRTIKTSAAGRYQITATTYDATAPGLGIADFTPASQDAIALELIRQRGALADVDAGLFVSAIGKVRKVWASLPGAGYNQPERSMSQLQTIFAQAGGTESAA